MQIGEEFMFNGYPVRVEQERERYSCDGCMMMCVTYKGERGCLATSEEREFADCKKDHVIFVTNEHGMAFMENRAKRVLVEKPVVIKRKK